MTNEDYIPRTETGLEKRDSYSQVMDRYEQAKRDGYYLECLVIIYARLEDCLDSILNKMDIAEIKGTKFVAKEEVVDDMSYAGYPVVGKNQQIEISGLSFKLDLLEKIHDGKVSGSEFWENRKSVMKAADALGSYKQLRKKIEKWNKKRNQYIHALMKKKYDSAYNALPDTMEVGMDLVKSLGNYRGRVITQMKNLKSGKPIKASRAMNSPRKKARDRI